MNAKQQFANGFTLAEIIISILLLSIFALGTFKTSHFAQHSANNTLQQFLALNTLKQKFVLGALNQRYESIKVDPQFIYLSCLVDREIKIISKQSPDCP